MLLPCCVDLQSDNYLPHVALVKHLEHKKHQMAGFVCYNQSELLVVGTHFFLQSKKNENKKKQKSDFTLSRKGMCS